MLGKHLNGSTLLYTGDWGVRAIFPNLLLSIPLIGLPSAQLVCCAVSFRADGVDVGAVFVLFGELWVLFVNSPDWLLQPERIAAAIRIKVAAALREEIESFISLSFCSADDTLENATVYAEVGWLVLSKLERPLNESITREIPVNKMLAPTKVPIIHGALKGY